MTESELGVRARDWAEVLFDLVPEERLLDAFKRAARDHANSFPVSAYDVKIAYEQIDKEDFAEASRIREKFLDDLDKEHKLTHRFECHYCFNSGWKENFQFDSIGTAYKGVIKCYECRYWEYARERLALEKERKSR